MSEEEPPEEEQTFKAFQFGGNESVVLPDEDANIGDAIATFNELHEARRTAKLPENEDFVEAITQSFREDRERLERVVSLMILHEILGLYANRMERAQEKGDREVFEGSAVFQEKEEDTFVADEEEIEERIEGWRGSPPTFCTEAAADFLDGINDWEKLGEWIATHVMYWAARDVNKAYWEEGINPEDVPEEEWDRRFNEQLTVDRYWGDAAEMLGAETAERIADGFKQAAEKESLSLLQIEKLLGLHEDETDAPAPRPSPSPFDMATGLAGIPTESVTRNNLKGVSGEGEWVEDSFGRPVYRYTIEGPPWGGKARLSLKEAIKAETAWKMLREGKGNDRPAQFHADAVTLYLLFLAYASDQAPKNRPGPNGEFRIPKETVFRILNLPANWDLRKKVRHVRNLNSYLQSFQVQFKQVTYEGERKRTEAISPAQLWDTYLRGVEESDLYGNTKQLDFWIEGREGAWADLFVHDNDTWTPWGSLPIRVLEDMDGRNSHSRRILFHMLILFRVEKGTVSRTGDHLLKWCGVNPGDLHRQTVYRRRRAIMNALDELKNQGFEIDDSRLRASKGTPLSDWQGQPVHFYPPAEIVEACPQIKPPEGHVPEPRSDVWTGKRVRALRKHIGDTQGEFGKRLPNRNGGTGVKQPRISTIENGPHNLTSRQEEKLDELANQFGFDG